MFSELSSLHVELLSTARRIEEQRAGEPWLAIEHGLDPDRVDHLARLLRDALRHRDLSDESWTERYLPLLVVAAEVGYGFGGDKRNFWPRLTERLGQTFDHGRRRRLIDLFDRQKTRPADTIWTRQFHLVAYPLTHALLPQWLQEPLFELLHEVAGRSEWVDFRALCDRVNDHPRLHPLSILINLDRERLAAAVIQGLLDDGAESALDRSLLRRFRRDVESNHRAKVLRSRLGTFIHLRGVAEGPSRRTPTSPSTVVRRRRADIALQLDVERLELSLPALDLRADLPTAYEHQPVCVLSERRPVSVGALLRRGAPITRLPPNTDKTPELLPSDAPQGVQALVPKLRVDVGRPLLFSERSVDFAVQSVSREFNAARGAWALTDERLEIDGAEDIGPVAGLRCSRLDLSSAEVRNWLVEHRVVLHLHPLVTVVGAPALDRPRGSTFAREDVVAIDVDNGPIYVDDVAVPDGLHQIHLGQADEITLGVKPRTGLSLSVTRSTQPVPDITLELSGADQTTDGLLRRGLTLRITGLRGLVGLRARLRVEVDGHVVARARTGPLPPLPCAVLADDPVWSRLAAGWSTETNATLIAEISGLARGQWALDTGRWTDEELVPEGAIADSQYYDARDPLRPLPTAPTGPHLVMTTFTDGLHSTGFGRCDAPKSLKLGEGRPERPERLRRSWGELEPILRGSRDWSSAKTGSSTAMLPRASVERELEVRAVRILCGERWERAEASLGQVHSVGRAAAERLITEDLAALLNGAAPRRRDALTRALTAAFVGAEVWLDPLGDADASEIIFAAVSDACARVGASRPADDLAEVLVHSARQTLNVWKDERRLWPLLRLTFPESARVALEALASPDQHRLAVVEGLERWLRTSSLVAPWPREQIVSSLTLWLSPSKLTRDEGLFERALADRLGSRAIRYVALRRRMGGEWAAQ